MGKTTYNLNLIVERGEFETTLRESEALLAHAKSEKMGTAVHLLLRSAIDKISKSFKELEARQALEDKATRAAARAAAAVPFAEDAMTGGPRRDRRGSSRS